MAVSSSNSASASFRHSKHDVFLSFRGVDTRHKFLRYLYDAFQRKGVEPYADFNGLQRGEEISHALLQAIEESMISIVVFSENYAASTWCLDELSKIMECWDLRRQLVVPIFYHVNPSDIRKQTRSFGAAFVEHEHERNRRDKVPRWKLALTQAGSLSGFTLTGDEPESEVIEDIVLDIVNKLTRLSKSDYNGFIGIGPQMEQIKSLLCIGGEDVRIIGIWGMGGIGKTTLAEVLYNEVYAKFEGYCFMANVRERSTKHADVIALRNELFSQLLNEKNLHIGTLMTVPTFIKNRLSRKRVLVILDDVNDLEQLEVLGINHDHFVFGSRIILTSRDKQILTNKTDEELIYEVKELSYNDSLQLFSLSAFEQNHPVDDFKSLSNSFLEYAKGVPLALKVLGSALHKKHMADWESALEGLKQRLDTKIQDVLKISYDGLHVLERNIFLDIAFFFKGYHRDHVTKILDGSRAGTAHFRISKLIDKCLLNVTSGNTLGMHDLIQEMGRNVVLAESQYFEERSRLWTQDDVRQVLEYGGGTKSIQGVLLDQSQIDEIRLHPGAFAMMRHLRIIKFYGKGGKLVPSDAGVESLPNELRCFHWEYCLLKSLPSKFRPEKLVELRLPDSKVEQLWNGKQDLVNLRVLDLKGCENLTRIPDLSAATNITNFNFCGCRSLDELPSMIHLKSLNCSLDAGGLNNLKKFPELPRHIKSLCLSETAIEKIPDSIGNLDQLDYLNMSGSQIRNLPSTIVQLSALKRINLSDCPNIIEFPNVPQNIELLILDNTAIEEVPSSISSLKSLAYLSMNDCKELKSFPTSICGLKSLAELHLSKTAIKEVPSSILKLESLSHWSMEDCTKLMKLPESICDLKSLVTLNLSGCSNLEHFPEILQTVGLSCLYLRRTGIKALRLWNIFGLGNLVFLQELHLSGLDIVEIPEGIKQHSNLMYLYLSCCKSLESLPELPPRLRCLFAQGCTSLERVSKFCSELGFSNLYFSLHEHLDKGIFVFNNCFNLDGDAVNNIVASTLLKIQRIAEEFALEPYARVSKNQDKSVFCCFPGREIPGTFKTRSTNSSITVRLSPACSRKRFLGFVLCIVVDFKHRREGSLRVYYEFRCGDHHKFRSNHPLPTDKEEFKGIKSNHVIVLFDAFESGIFETSRDRHFDEASFDFSVRVFHYERKIEEQIEVQKCGVNIVYVDAVRSNDNEVESSTNYRFDGEKAVDPTNETLEPSCDEENRCDASMSEPNSALVPNRLSLNCDVNNRDLEEDANDEEGPRDDPTTGMRARFKRRFGSDEEEEPGPQRPRYTH